MAVDLGRSAYEGYFNFSHGLSLVSGQALPAWEDQKQEIQDAWRTAAVAVLRDQHVGMAPDSDLALDRMVEALDRMVELRRKYHDVGMLSATESNEFDACLNTLADKNTKL